MADGGDFESRTYRTVTWRLLPFLFLCYILAYLDRVNVGFARLQMQADLGLSDTAYGIGAGMFFIGYFFFEVPSNLLLQRVGARMWIARIMVLWGLISSSMMFTSSQTSFYVLRFLLGVAEAGFFPGIILYLTFWYTRVHRARMVALFMTAIALAGVIGGPVSGLIMDRMGGVGGLRNWEWLYLLEGIPSVIVGLLVLWYLDDGPESASWLTAEQKALLARRLAEEEAEKAAGGQHAQHIGEAFRNPLVWVLSLIYFGAVMGNYGVTFWLPQIIRETITPDPWRIGLVSAIPWGAAAITAVLVGASSDRRQERRWHIAVGAAVGRGGVRALGSPQPVGMGRPRLPHRGDRRHDVDDDDVLGAAHRDPLGQRRGRGHRLDQLGGQSVGILEPVRPGRDPRCDARRRAPERQHVPRAARARGVALRSGGADVAAPPRPEERPW